MAGHGLLGALLLATLVGAAGMLASGELSKRAAAARQARSVAALAMAREALLGYAISYSESHPGEDYGYLPCPDRGNSGSTPPGACGARDLASLGRLPWRTLALPDLLDGWNECLWYAVAGSIKNNPKAVALNWDSPGQFQLLAANGAPLPVAAQDERAVAVVLAPGRALGGQHRSGGTSGPCTGGASAAADLAGFVDSTPLAGLADTIRLHQGLSDDEKRNDLLTWIGVDDIFDALRRRSDFAAHLDAVGERAASALADWLDDAGFIDSHTEGISAHLRTGMLPAAAALGLADGAKAHDNWRDQFRIAVCADRSACILVRDTDAATSRLCRAALLFGGERIRDGVAAQQRHTAAQRSDPAQFFEGDNAHHLSLGVPEFSGAAQFRIADPALPASEDVIRCIR